ncbi:MAG TPA: phosphoribosyltransferase family protein [Myxococcota bacterium]|nr:phosphoribosyltransferase family protein [Myxococcota bacterium]
MERNLDLAKLFVERSYVEGDFVLSSGRHSNYIFDCKLTTCNALAMPLVGAAFIDEFARMGTNPRSVGGLTMGADSIAQAIAHHSLVKGPLRDFFIVRKDRKEHGTRKWIEGCPTSPVAIVDDAVTSGGSVVKAIERCLEEKLEIVHVAVLVDREEGGMEAIRARLPGVPVTAVFQRSYLDALRGRKA